MCQATFPFANESPIPQPSILEPIQIRNTKKPLEPIEMAKERIETLESIEPIHQIKKPESLITLKKTQTI